MAIRDITSGELALFGDIVGRLASLPSSADVRASVFSDIVRLLRADFGASYVWQAATGGSEHPVNHNMDPANLRRYDEWFQHRDPMTAELRRRRRATLVDAVIPQRVLERTEFYNTGRCRSSIARTAPSSPCALAEVAPAIGINVDGGGPAPAIRSRRAWFVRIDRRSGGRAT